MYLRAIQLLINASRRQPRWHENISGHCIFLSYRIGISLDHPDFIYSYHTLCVLS